MFPTLRRVAASLWPKVVALLRFPVVLAPRAAPTPSLRGKRRPKRLGLMLMYSGRDYCGMQRQLGAPTIEGTLLSSLLDGGWVTGEQCANPGKLLNFRCASRTDSGVSAMAQVVTIELDPTPSDLAQVTRDLNARLPPRIRVLDTVRVTGNFGNYRVNYRTYSYLFPSFALTPNPLPSASAHRVNQRRVLALQDCLTRFRGTRNFYNFTSGREKGNPSCRRYIIDCRVLEQPVLYQGLEYLEVCIVGQSFMMHQIRNMIALSIAVVRGHLEPLVIDEALDPRHRLVLPRAPGLGLRLEELHYESYNKKFASQLGYPTIDWSRFAHEREAFKAAFLMPDLHNGETAGGSMLNWVEWLAQHQMERE